MKDEKESKEKIQRSSSSTSEVLESIDLTQRATTSTEPHVLNLRPSQTDDTLEKIQNEIVTANKSSRKLNIVTDVVNQLLDATVNRDAVPTTSGQQFLESNQEDRLVYHTIASQPNLRSPRSDLKVYRNTGGGLINSTSALHNENYVMKTNSKMTLKRVPPSYSTVLKLGAPSAPLPYYDIRTFPSLQFSARQPPPSYAEVHGWDDNPSVVSSESFILGPNPIYISCPRCRTIVISDTHSERSHLTYITSLVLCIFMCWPCCLMPFCVKAFRNTYHFCPTCHYYLGVYRPC